MHQQPPQQPPRPWQGQPPPSQGQQQQQPTRPPPGSQPHPGAPYRPGPPGGQPRPLPAHPPAPGQPQAYRPSASGPHPQAAPGRPAPYPGAPGPRPPYSAGAPGQAQPRPQGHPYPPQQGYGPRPMAPGQQPPHPGSRALSPQQQHPAPYGQPAPAPYSQPPGGNPAYYRPAPAHPTAPAQPAAPGSPNFSSPMDQLSGQMGAMGLNAPASQPRGGRAKRVYAQETGAGAAPPPVAGGPGYPPTSPGHGAPHPGQQPGTAPYQPYGPSAPAGGAAPYGQQTHHPQHHQPGPAAPSYEQAKPRIDPDQIPSPVQVHERDQALYSDTPYVTSLKTNVPLAATQFRAIDEGNANPRFARMTMYNIPQTEQLLRDSNLPLGMMIQPLAPLRYDETPLDVVDFGEKGPIRCGRCRAYVNPYFTFIEGGRKYVCNLCRHENEVPAEYFYNLDMTGRRLDWESRPELRCGSVEFAATREFINLEPAPLSYVFAIDVSWNAIQSGMLRECARALRNILYETEGGLHAGTRVGLVTYDKTVHFYNLAAGLEQPQMLVCPDVDHVFVPLHHGFLVDPQESREVIEALLDGLPTMFEANRTAESALGAVVQACQNALAKRGGKLMIFQASLPNYGPGALKSRDDPKLYNGDKERTLFASQDKFYPNLAEACVESGLSVNLYLFPNSYIDAATLSSLSSLTGGDTYFYPNFLADRDGHRFGEDLKLDLTREHGFNGVLRVRCSDGLRIDEHYGNFFMRNNTDVELAGIDSDKAIGVTFRHDGQLDEKNDLYFQMALLYTTAAGQRRIRVHNLAVPVTGLIGNMFRNAEMDTSVNLLAKMAVSETLAFPLRTVRDKLSDKCVRVLTAYRRHCAAGSSPGQLILPEAYKLLPLYVLAMTKTNALRPVMTSVDLRVTSMRMLKSINVQQSTSLFYPRIVPVHQLAPEHGQYDAQGHMQLPTLVRASYARLDPAGAYLFENGQIMRLWLGREVPTTFLQEALGVANQAEIDETATDLPALDTPTSQQVRAIVDHMQSLRTRYLQFRIVRQGMGQSDVDFASLLTEDKTTDGQSYVDYLCDIHRRIQIDISKSY